MEEKYVPIYLLKVWGFTEDKKKTQLPSSSKTGEGICFAAPLGVEAGDNLAVSPSLGPASRE
jgi:hypothetical protein